MHDYLWYIVVHALDAFRHLAGNMRSNIRREHELMPVYAARELDSKSAMWLSRLPGRNVREKLGHSGRLLAVRRRFTEDSTENRLLKAFAMSMRSHLQRYVEILGPAADPCMEQMLQLVSRWMCQEDVQDIGPWMHVPPNNTLLQHRHYRKIWDAWMRLQRLNEIIMHDAEHLAKHYFFNMGWNIIRRLQECAGLRLLQLPIKVDYEGFDIAIGMSYLLGWIPVDSESEGLRQKEVMVEMSDTGLSFRIDGAHDVRIRLSKDGKSCSRWDGDMWTPEAAVVIEDTLFAELYYMSN
jgi:hypothetical protein